MKTEYGLLVALIAIIVVASVGRIGGNLKCRYFQTSAALGAVCNDSGSDCNFSNGTCFFAESSLPGQSARALIIDSVYSSCLTNPACFP